MLAQVPDPAWEPLDKAFSALRAKDYDTAIRYFEQAADISPKRADIRKNLERHDNLVRAATELMVLDGESPELLGAMLDAAAYIPQGGYAP